tara:strand:+ start:24214 stop:25836 length:1623 start_codon:yes stop_codon:yes gene_type:complete
MATDWKTFPLEFKGGLISNLSPLQQGTNAVGSATILENFEPSLSGGYKKIKGFQKFNDNVVPVHDGSGSVIASPTDAQKLIQLIACVSNGYTALVARNDKFFTVNSTTIEAAHLDNATYRSQRTALNGAKIRFTNYNFGSGEKTAIVDGINSIAYYDGSQSGTNRLTFSDETAAETSPTVGAKFVAEFKNHLVLGKGNTIVFSAVSTDNDFRPANGGLEVNVKDTVTGLIVFREQLIVFTKNSIQRVTGSATTGTDGFKLSPITDDIGCIKEDTIREVGGDVLFFAPDGIRSLGATEKIGDFGLDVASKPIKKNVDSLNAVSFDSYVIREKAQYRLLAFNQGFDTSDSEGLIATKFVDQGGTGLNWATTKGIKSYASDSRYYGDFGAVAELILFAHDDGYIYQTEVSNGFDGTNIRGIYESPYMPIQDPTIRKTFYKMGLFLDPDGAITATVSIKYDQGEESVIQPNPISVSTTGTGLTFYNASSSVYDTSRFSQSFDKLYNNNVVGSGKTVAIRIEEESTNPPFRLDTAVLEYSTETRQ